MSLIKPIVTKHDLLMKLQQHIGRSAGINAAALAAALMHIPTRQVRTLVTELRMEGYAICGYPGEGYYIAANAAELEETCQFLRGRAMHSLSAEAALRRIPMADLLGQMRLKS